MVGKRFVGHCHSIMHEYATDVLFYFMMSKNKDYTNFWGGGGGGGELRLGGGTIPGPPPSV